jgi:hypothetical protein
MRIVVSHPRKTKPGIRVVQKVSLPVHALAPATYGDDCTRGIFIFPASCLPVYRVGPLPPVPEEKSALTTLCKGPGRTGKEVLVRKPTSCLQKNSPQEYLYQLDRICHLLVSAHWSDTPRISFLESFYEDDISRNARRKSCRLLKTPTEKRHYEKYIIQAHK